MGIDAAVFYDPRRVTILPMGLCFPGTGSGGDLLPRRQLTRVIGSVAQACHLKQDKPTSVTAVAAWRPHWPRLLPMPHPSPRNQRWLRHNPWFEQETLPVLRLRVQELI